MNDDCVLLLSGGLDSSVLLAMLRDSGRRVTCLSVNYGQTHSRELESARVVATHYGSVFELVELPTKLMRGSALTGGKVLPLGFGHDDPIQADTVVPGRNLLLISLAVATASSRGIPEVAFAAHRSDAVIYQDCRPEFVYSLSDACRSAYGVRIFAPFLPLSRADVVAMGRRLKVPFHLTWSCYLGGNQPCGECGACVERVQAGA